MVVFVYILTIPVFIYSCRSGSLKLAEENVIEYLDNRIDEVNPDYESNVFTYDNFLGYYPESSVNYNIEYFGIPMRVYYHPSQIWACANIDSVHPHYIFPDLENKTLLPDSIVESYSRFQASFRLGKIDSAECKIMKSYVENTPTPLGGYANQCMIRIKDSESKVELQTRVVFHFDTDMKVYSHSSDLNDFSF